LVAALRAPEGLSAPSTNSSPTRDSGVDSVDAMVLFDRLALFAGDFNFHHRPIETSFLGEIHSRLIERPSTRKNPVHGQAGLSGSRLLSSLLL
jgi:hypothetical protein